MRFDQVEIVKRPVLFLLSRGEVVGGFVLRNKSGETPKLPGVRKQKNPMERKMRWKDGSFLTGHQVLGENYLIKNKIA